MSKFEEILAEYEDILKEMPVPAQIDVSSLDTATGEQIRSGLAEILGDDQEKINQVLQGLIASKSINPDPSIAAPAA